MLCVQVQNNEFTSPKFCRAFAQGCNGRISEQYITGDWAGFASPSNWENIQKAKREGFNFYYGDHGYFGRRQFYRITKNKYQHSGIGQSDCKRFEFFGIEIKPWNSGEYVVLCPQSETFMYLHGLNRDRWIEDCVEEIKKHTDRKIIIRDKNNLKPFHRVLEKAYCVVTYSSNAAVEAIINGVPAITLSECAASVMSRNSISDIENLCRPENRLEWDGVLADNQWTLNEISLGQAWRKLNEEI